jgi:hypothetical protein
MDARALRAEAIRQGSASLFNAVKSWLTARTSGAQKPV